MNTLPQFSEAAPVLPEESARAAGLRYVSDDMPGIRRRRCGKGFSYVDAQGRTVRDPRTLERIRGLAIPPAWTDVWICPVDHGHIQATGRDDKGRKQFRYHPRWTETRNATKFHRMARFGELLPRIRRRVAKDLRRDGIPREKVLAVVVRLLEDTLVRVGNDEYARKNRHYGLTTLQDDHVEVKGARVRFEFVAKSGKERAIDLHDPHLARIVKQCRDVPGEALFQYCDDDNACRAVTSSDVNAYLRAITGEDISAKDFRTWAGSLCALLVLRDSATPPSQAKAKRAIASAVKEVAEQLGNTPAVCRKFYIHPCIFDHFTEGRLTAALDDPRCALRGLTRDERILMDLLP